MSPSLIKVFYEKRVTSDNVKYIMMAFLPEYIVSFLFDANKIFKNENFNYKIPGEWRLDKYVNIINEILITYISEIIGQHLNLLIDPDSFIL